ncbi:MAG TPA: hypothetical protein GXX26_04950 [Clostridiaceae bacterium]|nr:hypothetical protein [Clostridiaceae bacterium]
MKGKKIAFIICLATLITVGSLIYAFTSSHTRYPEWMEPLADMIEEEAPKWVSFGAELIDMDFDDIPEVFVSTGSTAGTVICNAYKYDGTSYKKWDLPEDGLGRREKEAISNDIPPENIFVQKYIDDMWSSLGRRIEYKSVFVRNAIFTGADRNDRCDIIEDISQWFQK